MSSKPASFPCLPKDWQFAYRLRPYHWLIIIWDVVMISIPIVRWVLGDQILHWGVLVGVILQVMAVLAILSGAWGAKRTLAMTSIVLPAAWLVERIGSSTGLPFGAYHYTALLQPQLGQVPLIIPLAWLMMLPPAWAVAAVITRARSRFWFILTSALAFTAWDFFLDPQMVGWGYWVWEQRGGYFGIPWTNFAGWVISAA
ncbi:MAG: carotenoid biosynthesis protein, partial [Chloroflexota bacterium]|nr:carotenoid biosynthesis protein [Chloroflexota bacterium]